MSRLDVPQTREYKLLLRADKLRGATPADKADQFWDPRLKQIIADHLDPRKNGKARGKDKFVEQEDRRVYFYDGAPDRLLDPQGFSLRKRIETDKHGNPKCEITLKLRLPALSDVAGRDLHGAHPGAKAKLEEDIGPATVLVGAPGGPVVLAERRSTHRRYALSNTQPLPCDQQPATIADVQFLYPTLLDHLHADPAGALQRGPEIEEVALKGAKVDLGEKVDGEFTLTLWTFEAGYSPHEIAEISFRHDIVDDPEIARRADQLFIAMQNELGDVLYLDCDSKTSLALPRETRELTRRLGR